MFDLILKYIFMFNHSAFKTASALVSLNPDSSTAKWVNTPLSITKTALFILSPKFLADKSKISPVSFANYALPSDKNKISSLTP